MEKDIDGLISYLQGTCGTLDNACEQFGFTWDDLTSEDFDKIDNEIFLCPICGWWCENCERTSNNISLDSEDICEDCHESGEEE